jgi:hypothetical protein
VARRFLALLGDAGPFLPTFEPFPLAPPGGDSLHSVIAHTNFQECPTWVVNSQVPESFRCL